MWLLRSGGTSVALALVVLLVAGLSGPSAAHPPDGPDHGIATRTFHALWSGDVDDGDPTAPEGPSADVRALAAATDLPFDAPPAAVERWNRGDHGEYPRTGAGRSIHPPGVALHSGPYVRDAFAAVFAVQPATRALVSTGERPLYVSPSGELLGTVDYRINVPDDSRSPNRTVDWRLRHHGIAEIRLLVDGRVVSSADGSHAPRLPYTLPAASSTSRTLTLEADIRARLARRIVVCRDRDSLGRCTDRDISRTRWSETATVRASIDVVPYDLEVTGARARYPDGDRGLALYVNRPWLGYAVPGGDVRGVWRFYAARDERWDTLVTHTEDGTSVRHSPAHPLYVHAYPIETGPTTSPRGTVTLVETYGVETWPPTLPENVNLDVLTVPYTGSFGLVARIEAVAVDPIAITAFGLVRGSTLDVTAIDEVPIHRSELSLTLVNATPETVTVRLTLRDAQTGAPVDTLGRDGHVVLAGERVETSRGGTVTRTLPRPSGGVSARYEPGAWWLAEIGYVGDSDVVYVRGTVMHALVMLYEIGVPVALFLFATLVVDRLTGWRIWPPWRRR